MPINPAVGNGRPRKRKSKKAPLNSGKEIARQQRVLEICELRKQGWPVSKIAVQQKVSRQRIDEIIRSYYRSVVAPVANEARALDLERLDELQAAHWEKAVAGDVFSTQTVLRIMEQRDRLLGLSAPQKAQVEEVGEVADAKASLLAKLAKMNERLQLTHGPLIEGEAIEAEQVEPKTVN